MVLTPFQPIENLFPCFSIRLSAFGIKIGQYLTQTGNTNVCSIRKSKHTPANCWLVGIIASRDSSNDFKVWHVILLP